MALARQQAQAPTPIRTLGALLIAPVGVPRRLINATIDALCEMTSNLLASRHHDADHDAYLISVERLAARGVQVSATQGCPCRVRYQSILADVRAAQAADQREDSFIDGVLAMARRWSLALERALKSRRRTSRAGGGRP